MSLNFVSSAILTSTDGVSHNEEKAVETSEAQELRSKQAATARPLFEQLRSNQDQAQEDQDARNRSLRGMRPLDEEDCAHLDSVNQVRSQREESVRRRVEDEVAAFRAARAERRAEGEVVFWEG